MKHKILTLLLVLAGLSLSAQEKELTGKVTDRNGRPVSGALVTVSGMPEMKVATAKDGSFKIEAVPGSRLLITAGNAGSKEVTVSGEEPETIVLDWKDETIILGDGIEQRREEVTGAVSVVKAEELMKNSVLNVQNALFGNALGLTALQNNGADWENQASFYIRGLKTLSDNGILVLVDGIERSIANMMPDEVESVEVLRDAAALALYGYRGINGALLIHTKRGKYKSRSIEVRYDHGFVRPFRLPEFVNAYDYVKGVNEAYVNDGAAPRYSEDQVEAWRTGRYPQYYADVDWVDEMYRDLASTNVYALNLTGGGMNARYYTLLSLEGTKGLFKGTEKNDGYSTQLKYSRANIRTNIDINISSTTKAQFNLAGLLAEHNRPGTLHASVANSIYQVPSSAFSIKAKSGNWSGNETYTSNNPIGLLQGTGYARAHTRALFADMRLEQDLKGLLPGLSAAARVSYDNTAEYWESNTKTYQYDHDVLNFDENGAPMEPVTTTAGEISSLSFGRSLGSQSRRYFLSANVDYERTFGKHALFSTFIYSYDHPTDNGQHKTYYRDNLSFYAHYGYDNRYFFDVAVTSSGSNRLTEQHRWAASPVVSAAWVLSNENFLKNAKAVDFLKLRASWGILNTDYVPEVNLGKLTYESSGGYYLKENDWYGGMTEGRLATRDPKNERATKYNVGIDAGLFKRINLTVDGYYEMRDRIFITTDGHTSSVLGATNPYENAGKVESKGVEVGLNYNDKCGDFVWNAGGQFTFNRSKIKEEYEEPSAYAYTRATGRPVNQIFGFEVVGFFKDEADIASSPQQVLSEVAPGDFKYKDQNDDKIIDANDLTAIGYNSACPEIYYSFNLGLEWKGFGLSALFQGAANYSVRLCNSGMEYAIIDDWNMSQDRYDNRWTPSNLNAKYPRLSAKASANNYDYANTTWVKDRSFLKLRNCEAYYNFPKTWISKAKMTSAKLYVRGMNVWSNDKMDELYDPEMCGRGYPATTSWHVGLSIGF